MEQIDEIKKSSSSWDTEHSEECLHNKYIHLFNVN